MDPQNQTWFWGSTIFKNSFKNPQVEVAKVRKPPAFCTRMNGSCYSFPGQESNEIPMWMMIDTIQFKPRVNWVNVKDQPPNKIWTAA